MVIVFDSNKLIEPVGFPNFGASCYFNSFIQCLLTCTSIENNIDNESALIGHLFCEIRKRQANNVIKIIYEIYQKILKTSHNQQSRITMQAGSPEDVNECLLMFFDCIEKSKLMNLFTMYYRNRLTCACGYQVDKIEKYNFITVPRCDNVNDYINKLEENLTDYKCDKCGGYTIKKISKIIRAAEIIIVLNIGGVILPGVLSFSSSGSSINYKLIAQSEYASGHYWAKCLRKNGCYNLNDMSVTPTDIRSTQYTYMGFYHTV